MNITPATVYGMTAQDKEIYFKHMEKRHSEEKEYIEARKNDLATYKESLISGILKRTNNYTAAVLKTKSIRALEAINMYA